MHINKGRLVQQMCSITESDELFSLLQILLWTGTVNRGSYVVFTGIETNDWFTFCKLDASSTEPSVEELKFTFYQEHIHRLQFLLN